MAEAIDESANGRTNRLRIVATADIKPRVQARRQTSEENYLALIPVDTQLI